jgi:DNA polymerase-3 subunit beta
MKSSTTKEQLVHAVSIAERLSGKKESLPILSCILLEAGENTLTIRSTNLEAGIEIVIPASVEDGGIVAVPAGVLSQTLRSIGGDSVTLKTVEGNLSIESRGSKNLIKATPHEEFPSLATSSKEKGFSIGRTHLLQGVQSVLYAASPSMIRPELGSVYISLDQGSVIAVATDSFRLAEKRVARATKKESAELLIPLKHANELVYVLERIAGEEIEIIADEAQCTVSGAGVRFMSRLVEAQFPNYHEIIPKNFETEATLLKSDFTEMLRKARVFSGNDQHVGFHVYPKRKIFSATARSSEIGEMSDSIDASLSGEDLDINFHIGYLSDCLPSIQSDSLTLSFAGPGKPLVIKGASDESFMYLVMPLNR